MSTESSPTKGLHCVRRQTLEEQVYKALRTALLEGRLVHGQKLVQEALASELGTSRVPVRDALRRLEAEGLVITDERGSYYVKSFGPEDVEEIYALRVLLEPYATSRAIPHLTAEDVEELSLLLNEMEQAARAGDRETYVQLNRKFHTLLYEASGQRRLLRIIQNLWSGLPPLTPLTIPGQIERSITEHRALLRALEARDAEKASEIVRLHVQRAGQALKKYLLQREGKGHGDSHS